MEIQSLETAERLSKEAFDENPNRSLSALYRTLRKRDDLRFFGDFPIMSVILTKCPKQLNRHMIGRMCRCGEDYNEINKSQKINFFKALVSTLKHANNEPPLLKMRLTKNLEMTKTQKTINHTSKKK